MCDAICINRLWGFVCLVVCGLRLSIDGDWGGDGGGGGGGGDGWSEGENVSGEGGDEIDDCLRIKEWNKNYYFY